MYRSPIFQGLGVSDVPTEELIPFSIGPLDIPRRGARCGASANVANTDGRPARPGRDPGW